MTDLLTQDLDEMTAISLDDLKKLKPKELIKFAEEVGVENAASMRKQDIFFAVLKDLAEDEVKTTGSGVLEVLKDGFGFMRAPEANYLPGPDDIYVDPKLIRKFGLKTGDTISGEILSPKENERYFALSDVTSINFSTTEQAPIRFTLIISRPFIRTSACRWKLKTRRAKTNRAVSLILLRQSGKASAP